MPRVEPGDYEALANFRYLLRKFLRFSKDFLSAKSHLSPEQYEALLAIKVFASSGGLNISQLSERLQVRHHSAVNVVDRLVERKLITREAVGSDRRRRFLELTPQGDKLIELTPQGDKLIEELAFGHRQEIRGRSGELIEALERLRK